jgi:hypothetical protein
MAQVLARVDLANPWAQSVLLAAGTARDGGAGGPLLQVTQGSQTQSALQHTKQITIGVVEGGSV